jgi:hypothetical protein
MSCWHNIKHSPQISAHVSSSDGGCTNSTDDFPQKLQWGGMDRCVFRNIRDKAPPLGGGLGIHVRAAIDCSTVLPAPSFAADLATHSLQMRILGPAISLRAERVPQKLQESSRVSGCFAISVPPHPSVSDVFSNSG